jgi:crotonobetainyl-CoA:carnitine CoA-transferase CaiB-like acyl-CoA transferase
MASSIPKTKDAVGSGPLGGARVVECGQGVSAAFAAKLLSQLGAEVIKVEPPEGDLTRRRGPFPEDTPDLNRSGLFMYLNANKLGVMLDLTTAADRARLLSLLAGADMLIHNVPPAARDAAGLNSAALSQALPHLIVSTISPFGDTGPRAHYRAYELNVIHAGGPASANLAASDPALAPAKLFGHQADFQGGLHGALVTLAAFYYRLKSGRGQVVDVSQQEILAPMIELNWPFYSYAGKEITRLGGRFNPQPADVFECADGKVLMTIYGEHIWRRFVEFMGNPQWARQEIYQDAFGRVEHGEEVRLKVAEWTSNWKVADLCRGLQKLPAPIEPVYTIADVYNDPHMRERRVFVQMPIGAGRSVPVPGSALRLKGVPESNRPAPALGEHSVSVFEAARGGSWARNKEMRPIDPADRARADGPLAGVRVLDFTWVWAGPYGALQMAHLGADVIRVESARRPCMYRNTLPMADDIRDLNRAGGFNQWNQGKRSIALDLTKPEAVEITKQLVRHCDAVVENFAAGSIARMGLGYETLKQFRPDLIMLSMAGYGQTGPYSTHLSFGALIEAMSGFTLLNGYKGRRTRSSGLAYPDPTSGVFGAVAMVAALIHRARTGEGQHIDLAMLESVLSLMPEALLEYAIGGRLLEPIDNHDPWMAPHNCYKALGNEHMWVSIAVGTDDEWRALCGAIGQPALADDPRFVTAALRKQNEAELDRIIETWTASRDRWEITEKLQAAGVAAFPNLGAKDLVEDPHMKARGYHVQLPHPVVGTRIHAGIGWKMSATPCHVRKAAPMLGEDTDTILKSLLGYSSQEIERLRQKDVLT